MQTGSQGIQKKMQTGTQDNQKKSSSLTLFPHFTIFLTLLLRIKLSSLSETKKIRIDHIDDKKNVNSQVFFIYFKKRLDIDPHCGKERSSASSEHLAALLAAKDGFDRTKVTSNTF